MSALDGRNAPWERAKRVRELLNALTATISPKARRNEPRDGEPLLAELFDGLYEQASQFDEMLFMEQADHDEPIPGVHRSYETLADASRARERLRALGVPLADIGDCGTNGRHCFVCRECLNPDGEGGRRTAYDPAGNAVPF